MFQYAKGNPYHQTINTIVVVRSEELREVFKEFIQKDDETTITVKLPAGAFLIREPLFGSVPVYYKLFMGNNEPLRLKTYDKCTYELENDINQKGLC